MKSMLTDGHADQGGTQKGADMQPAAFVLGIIPVVEHAGFQTAPIQAEGHAGRARDDIGIKFAVLDYPCIRHLDAEQMRKVDGHRPSETPTAPPVFVQLPIVAAAENGADRAQGGDITCKMLIVENSAVRQPSLAQWLGDLKTATHDGSPRHIVRQADLKS